MKITVVFDGWQAGWPTEKKERQKGVEVIFSKAGEKADEVIKRLLRERGSGATVVTSDREISNYASRMTAAAIPSEEFKGKMERTLVTVSTHPSRSLTGGSADNMPGNMPVNMNEGPEKDEEGEEGGLKRKGPSRRLSKKEKRKLAALKRL